MLEQISVPVFAHVCEFVGDATTLLALESTCHFTREAVRHDNRLWYLCYATTYYGLQDAAESPIERLSVIPNNDWRRIHIERSLVHMRKHAECRKSMANCPVMGDFEQRMCSLLGDFSIAAGSADHGHSVASDIFDGMFFSEFDRKERDPCHFDSSSPSLIRFLIYPVLRSGSMAHFASVPYAPVQLTFSSLHEQETGVGHIRGRLAKFMSHMLSFSSSPNSAFVISAWSPRLPFCSPSVITSREAIGVLCSQLNIPSFEHNNNKGQTTSATPIPPATNQQTPKTAVVMDQDVLLQFVLVCVGQPTTKQALHYISTLIAHETSIPMA